MANQYNTEIYEIGTIFEDMKIIDHYSKLVSNGVNPKQRRIYLIECVKCGRRKEILKKEIDVGKGLKHRSCCERIQPKDDKYKKFQRIWQAMRTRTTNENQRSWKDYYDVSSEYYKDFIDFYDDLFESFVKHVEEYGLDNTTIDRIDPTGDEFCSKSSI